MKLNSSFELAVRSIVLILNTLKEVGNFKTRSYGSPSEERQQTVFSLTQRLTQFLKKTAQCFVASNLFQRRNKQLSQSLYLAAVKNSMRHELV